MSTKIRGFALPELVVLILIFLVLLAVLLPSLGRARNTAKTVRCASNLKQLYTGIILYAAMNDDWMMPAVLNNGNSPADRWYGTKTLGPMFGTTDVVAANDQAKVEAAIKKMLDCPAVAHPLGWGPALQGGNGKWEYDYTYNQMLGSNKAAPLARSDFLYRMVRRADLPRTTLLMTEVRDVTNIHDYVFDGLTPALVPTSTTNTADYQAIAGTPHQRSTSGLVPGVQDCGNMLFADGQVLSDDINKLLGPPPATWVVDRNKPQSSDFPFH